MRMILLAGTWLIVCGVAPVLAANDWPYQQQAGSVSLYAEFLPGPQLDLTSEFTQLQQDLWRELGIEPTGEQIHIFLFSRPETYHNYVQWYFPDTPKRRALFVKWKGQLMVFAYRSDRLLHDVRHELTHALLHASRLNLPLWLDEGIAEYFEVPRAQRVDHNPHLGRVQEELAQQAGMDLPALSRLQAPLELEEVHYRYCWAWIHFCLHGCEQARAELLSYLRQSREIQHAEPLARRLVRRNPQVQQQFVRHFRAWKGPLHWRVARPRTDTATARLFHQPGSR